MNVSTVPGFGETIYSSLWIVEKKRKAEGVLVLWHGLGFGPGDFSHFKVSKVKNAEPSFENSSEDSFIVTISFDGSKKGYGVQETISTVVS